MWLPVGRLRQRQSWDGGLDPVGEQGALGPLPQGLSPLQPHARLGPRPSSGQQARSPAPTQVPAAGCPAGGSCQGWPPPWAPPDVFQGPRDPSAPRGAFLRWPPAELAPSPRSGGSLSRFFPGYSGPQASGPAPGASRPRAGSRPHPLRPGGAASEDLSGTPGSPARAQRGGVLGAGRSTPAFHVPFPRWAPSGPPLSLPFSPIRRPLPPLGFLGWKKGPGRGAGCAGGKPGPTQRLAAGPLPGGASRRPSQLLVPTPAGLVPDWKKGAFASL